MMFDAIWPLFCLTPWCIIVYVDGKILGEMLIKLAIRYDALPTKVMDS